MGAEKILWIGLAVYGGSTLTSMAGMSLGFGWLLFMSLIWVKAQPVSRSLGSNLALQTKDLRAEWVTFLRISIGLAFVLVLSLFASWVFPLKFAGRGAPVHVFSDSLKIWYLFLPFFLGILFSYLSFQGKEKVIQTWLGIAGIVSLVGIFQFFTGWPRPQKIPYTATFYHATLFFGHHLSTASILIFPFFASLSLAFGRKTSRVPFIYKTIAGLSFLTLFLTWSRTLWVALPLGLILWMTRFLKRKHWVTGLVALGVLLSSLALIPEVRDRVSHRIGTQDRFELWKANLEFFERRPILGVGWRKPEFLVGAFFEERYPADWMRRFAGHAHNNVLEMLSGTGILGTLFWLFWSFWVLRRTWILSRRNDYWGDLSWGVLCAWLVFHLNGLTQVNFWEGKVLHQLMWVTGILLSLPLNKLVEESSDKMPSVPQG